MLKKLNDKNRKRLHRKIHIRKSIYGTAERPRMTVTRSNKNLSVQVINDDEGKTLASISTLEKEFADVKPTIEGAAKLGEALGARLKDKNISKAKAHPTLPVAHINDTSTIFQRYFDDFNR
mgnify:CR=1 FL=1